MCTLACHDIMYSSSHSSRLLRSLTLGLHFTESQRREQEPMQDNHTWSSLRFKQSFSSTCPYSLYIGKRKHQATSSRASISCLIVSLSILSFSSTSFLCRLFSPAFTCVLVLSLWPAFRDSCPTPGLSDSTANIVCHFYSFVLSFLHRRCKQPYLPTSAHDNQALDLTISSSHWFHPHFLLGPDVDLSRMASLFDFLRVLLSSPTLAYLFALSI